MKVYLAGRYSRRDELYDYARQLRAHGVDVTSRWLNGEHQWSGDTDDGVTVQNYQEAERFAREDLEDLDAADMIVCFTESPRTSASRGGRHVEMGYALASLKEVMIVGPRENVFYTLPEFVHHDSWTTAKHDSVLRAKTYARMMDDLEAMYGQEILA